MTTEINLKVWHSDGNEIGGSGVPLRRGWWWQTTIDGHRARSSAESERAAWRDALLDLFERIGAFR